MDKITKALLDEFVKEQSLNPKDESEAFEHFGNYSVISNEYSDQFDIEDVHAGSGNDTGLDGIGIIVNGSLVTDTEEIDDLVAANKYLDATFVFVQNKTSSKFEGADFATFAFGVKDFFVDQPSLVRNDAIKHFAALQEHVFKRSTAMTRGKPECKLAYVTTGKWTDDQNLVARFTAAKRDLEQLALFRTVDVTPIDADALHKLYNATKNKVRTEIQFNTKITLPDIKGIEQAYLGLLPGGEYLKLISDLSGGIRKSLFYDNVRDFQGDNDVNKEIAETFTGGFQDRFCVLNNGVTIVAKNVQPVGNKFLIEDYQIVNGCQTSHVIFQNGSLVNAATYVPVKIVMTSDENIMHAIIKATNRQTSVGIENLESLSSFQKKLEAYYSAIAAPNNLYYERRSRQYNGQSVEKVRIVTLPGQLRHFAAMFLNEPHRASRYYGTLLTQINKKVFLDIHDPIPYYTSAYCNYKMDTLFRNGGIDTKYKIFRYHILMILRHQLAGKDIPALNSHKVEAYCNKILTVVQDSTKAITAFQAATSIIDKIATGSETRDTVKTQSFTDNVLAQL